MQNEIEVHIDHMTIGDSHYEIKIFARPDGSHVARTLIARGDLLVNDGLTVTEALSKQKALLPLAIDSRRIVQEFRRRTVPPEHQN